MAEPDTHEARLANLMRAAQDGNADAYGALMQELAKRDRTPEAEGDVAEGGGGGERHQRRCAEGRDASCDGRASPEAQEGSGRAMRTADTETLIRQLAGRTPPVRPLARPGVRAAAW